ncbi:MAG: RNA-processing protein [Candidatus Aenigmatarchaeota archaeon]
MIRKIKIPEARISVLRGACNKIEKCTGTKIQLNDDVTITGEPLDILTTENIIKAIGRGFDPDIALELIEEDKTLCIIQLPGKEKNLIRTRARIIGTSGKCKNRIELLTRTYVSIYGKTICIIGKYENVYVAKAAVEKLIAGSMHKTVYEFLEKRMSKKGLNITEKEI